MNLVIEEHGMNEFAKSLLVLWKVPGDNFCVGYQVLQISGGGNMGMIMTFREIKFVDRFLLVIHGQSKLEILFKVALLNIQFKFS